MSALAEALRSPEEIRVNFSSFLQSAPVGMAQCHRPGYVTASNLAFARLLGRDSMQCMGSLADLIGSQDGNESGRFLAELFAGERDSFQVESLARRPEGLSLCWTVWAVHGEGMECASAVVLVEDLSVVAAARHRLQQAERLESIGRLAGGVAHDFNNLLTGVLLYCDLLLSTIRPGDRARKYAEEIRNAGLQASGLVRQLLTVVRANKSVARPVSLNEVAEGMSNLLVRLIGENIQLRLRLDPALGLVKIDPVQVQQLLLNLVLNARDAMPEGGEISVETGNCKVQVLSDCDGKNSENASVSCALFAVEDNGQGMDDSVRAHLFEPFFTTKPGKGTGMGLAIVHDIVTSNGGLIHVHSEPGKGSRISILLPLIPEPGPKLVGPTSFHPTQSGEVLSFQSEESMP